jgi:hypothetical protein
MRRTPIALSLCLLLALVAVGCDDDDDDDGDVFRATLSGANEVPAQTTTATGTATLTHNNGSVDFSIQVNGITAVTGAHIHSGAAGANGPVRVTLFGGPTTGDLTGSLAQGTFRASDVTGISFDDLLNEMRNGSAYVNVHTTAAPDGLIRGQIQRVE